MKTEQLTRSHDVEFYKSDDHVVLTEYVPQLSILRYQGMAEHAFGYNQIVVNFLNVFYFDLPTRLQGFEISAGTDEHLEILRNKLDRLYDFQDVAKPFIIKSCDSEFLVGAGAWTISGSGKFGKSNET
jgi:hypothetical protein